MAPQTKKISKGKLAAEIGAGLIAAGAAAGYYFYGSKKAKKHRKIAAKWANDMKKDVVTEAKKLKKVDAKSFAKVVDAVAHTYQGVRAVSPSDIKRAGAELKANLQQVRREMEQTGRKGVSHMKTVGKRAVTKSSKTVRKVAKKAARKSTQKAN
jgi:hypothetical protein